MNFLLALQYFPAVLSAVIAVEATITSETPGTTKKQIIIDTITAALKSLTGLVDPKVLALISSLIDAVVGVMNIVGIFKKKTNAVAVAPIVTP